MGVEYYWWTNKYVDLTKKFVGVQLLDISHLFTLDAMSTWTQNLICHDDFWWFGYE